MNEEQIKTAVKINSVFIYLGAILSIFVGLCFIVIALTVVKGTNNFWGIFIMGLVIIGLGVFVLFIAKKIKRILARYFKKFNYLITKKKR
jgi:hypothetical protein